ncbi:TPA: hypothetical protein PBR36_004008 [Escherichia coli]|nr:hypothetical protein [Escherichia coli]
MRLFVFNCSNQKSYSPVEQYYWQQVRPCCYITPYRAMNHPVIGVVTKADLASMEQISLVKSWLREAGAHNVLVTSAVNNNGVTELFALLHTEEGCC